MAFNNPFSLNQYPTGMDQFAQGANDMLGIKKNILQNETTQTNLNSLNSLNQARINHINQQASLLQQQAAQQQAMNQFITPQQQQNVTASYIQNLKNAASLNPEVARQYLQNLMLGRQVQMAGGGPYFKNTDTGEITGNAVVGPTGNLPLNDIIKKLTAGTFGNPSVPNLPWQNGPQLPVANAGNNPYAGQSPQQLEMTPQQAQAASQVFNQGGNAPSSSPEDQDLTSQLQIQPATQPGQLPPNIVQTETPGQQASAGQVEQQVQSMKSHFGMLKNAYQGQETLPGKIGYEYQKAKSYLTGETSPDISNAAKFTGAETGLVDTLRQMFQGPRSNSQVNMLINGLSPMTGESRQAYAKRLDAYQGMLENYAQMQADMAQNGIPFSSAAAQQFQDKNFDVPTFYQMAVSDKPMFKQIFAQLSPVQQQKLRDYQQQMNKRRSANG